MSASGWESDEGGAAACQFLDALRATTFALVVTAGGVLPMRATGVSLDDDKPLSARS